MTATIDLTDPSSSLKTYFSSPSTTFYDEKTPVYSPSWVFTQSATKMFVCADDPMTPSFYCKVIAFYYWFTNPLDDLISYTGNLIRKIFLSFFIQLLIAVLQARFLFSEGFGSQINDVSGNLLEGYLGDSDSKYSPVWLSTVFFLFDKSSHPNHLHKRKQE